MWYLEFNQYKECMVFGQRRIQKHKSVLTLWNKETAKVWVLDWSLTSISHKYNSGIYLIISFHQERPYTVKIKIDPRQDYLWEHQWNVLISLHNPDQTASDWKRYPDSGEISCLVSAQASRCSATPAPTARPAAARSNRSATRPRTPA